MDRPCRHLASNKSGYPECVHPLINHLFCGGQSYPTCQGCPCHEPKPDPTPDTCRWTQDQFQNWFSGCSGVMPTVTPWDGRAIHGMFCPECGKRITTQVHDKP